MTLLLLDNLLFNMVSKQHVMYYKNMYFCIQYEL